MYVCECVCEGVCVRVCEKVSARMWPFVYVCACVHGQGRTNTYICLHRGEGMTECQSAILRVLI